MSVNPVCAALVGLVVLNQHLVPSAWGAILVIAGVHVIAVVRSGRPGPPGPPRIR